MAEPRPAQSGVIAQRLDSGHLLDWLHEQRWFGAKSQTLSAAEVVEEATVADDLTLALVQVQFATGAHELYQLLLSSAPDQEPQDVVAQGEPARRLLSLIDEGGELEGLHGMFSFRNVGAPAGAPTSEPERPASAPMPEPVRPVGAEQSNSSVVFGDRIVLKLFRKIEPGINPDLEMLRFLTAHQYPNIAPLHGWYEYEGEALAGTLAIAQRYLADAVDGWELALEQIPTQPDAFLERLTELGTVTARLHSCLASDSSDPAFCPQEPSVEFINLLRATLDEQLEKVFGHLPDDDERVAPIIGLEQEVREHIALPSQGSIGGRSIRIHGDYHLGQTLRTDGSWTLLDFEGEPQRPLNVRRQKRSPLRDVASMLRSFSYATWAVKLQRGLEPPEGFEDRARAAFLDAYCHEVDASLLPNGDTLMRRLLDAFELEKALYELQYELDHRPDWVPIPVAGILRLLEDG